MASTLISALLSDVAPSG